MQEFSSLLDSLCSPSPPTSVLLQPTPKKPITEDSSSDGLQLQAGRLLFLSDVVSCSKEASYVCCPLHGCILNLFTDRKHSGGLIIIL